MSGNIFYLSLGANLGDREATIREALRRLGAEKEITLLAVSSLYETAPWGKTDQPAFLNAAAKINTPLTPLDLLALTQRLEADLGRVRHEKWGPRTIDIDLLFAPGLASDTEVLRLPHPYLTERAFVLVPLAEIAPAEKLRGRTIKDWLAACPDKSPLTRLGPENIAT